MSFNSTELKQIVLPEGIVTLKTDGIVYVKYAVDTTVDLDVQARMLDAFNEITEKKLTPFLFEAEDGVTVTKEARDNAIVMEESTPCKATAVLVQNIAYAMIANFYVKFNKPKRPFKVFNKKNEAIEWLKLHL
ncbi:MAG: hypothetical protein IPJ60_07930 [Sphingobacteriaceae bacterium]|nr:hypothetical protein [Sphingobacteriaceae bacterium]